MYYSSAKITSTGHQRWGWRQSLCAFSKRREPLHPPRRQTSCLSWRMVCLLFIAYRAFCRFFASLLISLSLISDQGWGDVGYNKVKYNHPSYKSNWTFNPPRTPNLDAMAVRVNLDGIFSLAQNAYVRIKQSNHYTGLCLLQITPALQNSENSILFHRFYAGSGVCSPTRSAFLTGRTPNRECISGAEGCGQKPVSIVQLNI